MYYVYVIQNLDGLLYKGSTSNLNKRIKQHNSGGFSSYTKNKGPWECVYKEAFKTRKETEVRERFLKTGKGREFLKNKINKN